MPSRTWHAMRHRYEFQDRKVAANAAQERLEWEFWSNRPNSYVWQSLGCQFDSLAHEERVSLQERPGSDCGLRAYCEYNSDRNAIEEEMSRQRLLCLLYRLESGTWLLSSGPNEYFKVRVEALMARAGRQLNPPQLISPSNYWMHRVCVYLRRNDSDGLFIRDNTGGIIKSVCQSSATFCTWLEKEALETQMVSSDVVADDMQQCTTDDPPLSSTSGDPRTMVNRYIQEVLTKTGKKITKKDIWTKAGYGSRTEFERWERQDPERPNKAADRSFRTILREKPHLK
jgi:hypothetical protein